MFKVRKKDGTVQDFDRMKIVQAVMNAGGTPENAEQVAAEVEAWLPTVAVEGVIESRDLRIKGIEVLKTVNPTVATTFEAYAKPNCSCPNC